MWLLNKKEDFANLRKLFLMLGAPASGKDYWIKQHQLEDYTITPDVLRQQFTTPHYTFDDNLGLHRSINNDAEKDVWDAVRSSVHDHLKRGQFAVVNATNLFKGAFRNYNKDRIAYHYQVYVIDTMAYWFKKFDYDAKKVIDQLVINDMKREPIKWVGKSVIEKYVMRYVNLLDENRQVRLPDGVHYVSADDHQTINALLSWQWTDMSKFNRIKVIGDIHGDYDALEKVFDDHKKGDAYVFVGDYLDRGTKSPEVFKFVTQELGGDNLFFLKGNHETAWEKYQISDKRTGQFSYDSLPKLQAIYEENELKKIIRKFAKGWRDYLCFEFNKKFYYVSHAGIEPFMANDRRAELYSDGMFVEGIGPNNNPYARDIDKAWNNQIAPEFINVHGHRNVFDHFQVGNSFNLTKDGKFRWLVIDNEGIHTHEIDRINVPDFTQKLLNEDHIKQMPLEDGIIANNFDKTAFRKGIWNDMTVKARGLFTRGDEIVGRGFNKFFQVNERPEDTLDSLVFPVECAFKYNGFLGIVFWDKQENKLRVYSKGGNEEYSQLAKQTLLADGWYDRLNSYFAEDEINKNTTILFEIINPKDQHIVDYHGNTRAVPLAIVQNDTNGEFSDPLNNRMRREISEIIAEQTYFDTATNVSELKRIIDRFEYLYPTQEGLVLYGRNKLLKYKTKFYLKAKELRGTLQRPSHRKNRYHYGAEDWVNWCNEHDETRFSPQLALELYKMDQEGMLNGKEAA